MTKTTTNDLSIEAAQAAEELQAAQDKARALEAKAQLAEQQRQEQLQADRLAFEQQRRQDFGKNFGDKIKPLRQEFEQAVINGGDTLHAWITYMEAVHKAAQEQARFTRFFDDLASDRYDAIAKQVNGWNTELSHYHQSDHVRPAYDHGSEPRGPWSAVVEYIASKTKRQTRKPKTRVQQINNELNALSAALGYPLDRDLDSTEHIMIQDLATKPTATLGLQTSPDRYEKRTYQRAVQDAIEAHLQQVRPNSRQDFEAYQNRAR